MKTFITIVLTMQCVVCLAQSDSALTFTDVVMVDSTAKIDLYERARHWFVDYFNSAKTILQVSDRESGELIAKPLLHTWYNYHYFGADHKIGLDMPVTIRIMVKDNKYRYEVYDITTSIEQGNSPFGGNKPLFGPLTTNDECPNSYSMVSKKKADLMWQDCKKNSTAIVKSLIEGLHKYMINKNPVFKDDF